MTDDRDGGTARAAASEAAPREYAARLTADLASMLGPVLEGAYLHGSAALGGWVADRSDVDILVVVADDVTDTAVGAVADLVMEPVGCPGRGLECSVVTASQAARPAPPWPFILHASSRGGGRVLVRGSGPAGVPGDPDLLMHYAVSRVAGIAMIGPPPEAAFGPIGRREILGYLADELAWGLANAPESYAVLNACRALVFLRDDRIVSKVAGGLAALERGAGPVGLIRRALDQQQARAPERPAAPEAVLFVRQVAAALKDGNRVGHGSSRRGLPRGHGSSRGLPPGHGL